MGNLCCYDKIPCSEVNSTDSSDQPFKDIYSPREKQWISNIPTSTSETLPILKSSGKTYI